MEGKCHASSSKSGEALRKNRGVKKASEMLLDFSGRKNLEKGLDAVSESTTERPFSVTLRLQLKGPQNHQHELTNLWSI